MITYAAARSTVAAGIRSAVGDDWVVVDHPADAIGDQAILIAASTDEAITHCNWRRGLILAVVGARHVIEETTDIFDQITPVLRVAIEGIDGGQYDREQSKRISTVEIGGTEFLMQVHDVTIETTN